MCLERMFLKVESSLLELARRLCDGPPAPVAEQADATADEHDHLLERLKACQRVLVATRKHLREREARLDRLSTHVQSYMLVHDGPRAYEAALEMDALREQIAGDRRALRGLLAEEKRLLDDVRALRRRHQELTLKLSPRRA